MGKGFKGFEIIKHLGTLNTSGQFRIEANILQWFGQPPRLDIRKWQYDKDGEREKSLSGICLDEAGMIALRETLAKIEGFFGGDEDEKDESTGQRREDG